MKLGIVKSLYVIAAVGFLGFTGCKTIKAISFETPIDTSTKPISMQLKKTFHLKDVDVYANNEFDGARLNGFEKINDSTALVIIEPENVPINNSPYYAFKTWSLVPKPFYFMFKYPKGFKHRYIPKIKKDDLWSVLDSTALFQSDSIVTIKLNLSNSPLIVAGQEIQSSKDVGLWYTQLLKRKENIGSLKSLGKTPLGRNLPVIDLGIGSPKGKDVIVLLTRQHPPEVTGYFAFQNFVETIADGSYVSNQFLENYHLIIFPIMNPDGVDLGHWRHNSGGIDLNRDWSVYIQPETQMAVTYITKSLKKNRSRLVLGLDFHSTWYDVFYTNADRANTSMPLFIDQWFAGLEANIPDYEVNEESSNSKRPVSKGWFLKAHNAVGITYEIGDATPMERIATIGTVSAKEMMRIMLTK